MISHCKYLTYSSVQGHLGYFRILAIANVITMGVQISHRDPTFVFFRYMPRSGIAGSYGGSIFNLLRNLHTVFCSGCNKLHPHQKSWSVLFSPDSSQHLLTLVISFLFDGSPCNRSEMISHCGLICSFGWLVMWSLFSCTCWPFVCLLWKKKMSIQLSTHFNWIMMMMVMVFAIELYRIISS